jgi:tetratricopeptide (TPR) repeat protein/class 3 adenylate cyclase
VKRKIAAILAADIAGYSRLVGEDEEDTLRRLESYRAVFGDFIARFGGRIFNTAGDAILAEFASAVDAVRCAVDTQESLRTRNLAYPPSRQMHFRIGITIGDVVQREGDLLGEGVNIAARLESIAPAGGICVSRSVHEAVANKISLKFADVGEQQLKNLPDRIHAYTIALEPAGAHSSQPLWKGVLPEPYLAGLTIAISVLAIAMGIYLIDAAQRKSDDSPAQEVVTVAATRTDAPTIVPPTQDSAAQEATAAAPPEATSEAPAKEETAKAPPATVAEEEEGPGTDDEKCATVDKERTAIAACTRLLDQDGVSRSDRATYRSNRGAAHLNRGDYDLALEDLNESLLLVPNDATAIYNRGATYFYRSDFDRAAADLKRAVKLDPKHAKSQYYFGRTLHQLRRYDEAVTHLTRAIALEPKLADYYRYRADTYLDKGEYKRAIADYDEAIRLNDKYAEAYRGRGITWLNDGNTDKAIDDLTEAVNLAPADWFARSARGSAYTMAGRFEDAIADETEALRLDPNNAEVLNRRADARVKGGKPNEALTDVERALAIQPEFAVALATRGEIYEALGRKAEAIADFKRALGLDSSVWEANEGLKRLDPAGLAAISQSETAGNTAVDPNSCAKFLPLIGKTIWAPCAE